MIILGSLLGAILGAVIGWALLLAVLWICAQVIGRVTED